MLLKKSVTVNTKNALLNKKCSRYPINRIQSKVQRIGTYEINKVLLSYFDDKMYILINRYSALALGY